VSAKLQAGVQGKREVYKCQLIEGAGIEINESQLPGGRKIFKSTSLIRRKKMLTITFSPFRGRLQEKVGCPKTTENSKSVVWGED